VIESYGTQAWFYIGAGEGQLPPPLNLGLAAKYFSIYVQKGAFCGLQNTPKCVSGRGCAPDSTGGDHDAPADP